MALKNLLGFGPKKEMIELEEHKIILESEINSKKEAINSLEKKLLDEFEKTKEKILSTKQDEIMSLKLQVSELIRDKKSLEGKISLKTQELDELRNFNIAKKQWERIEKNLKDKQERINILEKENSQLKESLERLSAEQEYTEIIDDLNSKLEKEKEENRILLEKVLQLEMNLENETTTDIRYRLLTGDLYEARKYELFKKICEEKEIEYVDDIEKLDFEELIKEGYSEKKIKNARILYEHYRAGIIPIEVEDYLKHGHRVSKIFFRYRSFMNFLNEKGIVYMSSLSQLDLTSLEITNKFKPDQIEKIKSKLEEYNRLRKINY